MKYEIMLYTGIIGSIIMLIITVIISIKCKVIEVIKDMIGIKISSNYNPKGKENKREDVVSNNGDGNEDGTELITTEETSILDMQTTLLTYEEETTILGCESGTELLSDETEILKSSALEADKYIEELNVIIVSSFLTVD